MTSRAGFRAATAAAVAAAVATLPACGGAHPAGPRGETVLVGRAEPVVHGTVTAAQVAADETAFGLGLANRVCAQRKGGNVLVSPASAAQALGMLDAGAAGSTRAALTRLLHLPTWSPALVGALHDQSTAVRGLTQVALSNHLFTQVGGHPTERTLDDVRQAFGADLRMVDFAAHADQSTAAINATVAADTHRLIPRLFDDPLDSSTGTVLTDAVYLHANWQSPFESASPGPFHTASGRTVTTSLMRGSGLGPVRTAGGWRSVALPYQGRALEAVLLLPPAAEVACPLPTPAALLRLTSGPSTGSADVVLPALRLTAASDLTAALAQMGLPLTGDYTGFGPTDTDVSRVVQKVVLDVDRNGTTAAAATGVAIATSGRMGTTVTFDRPFLMVLQDAATHSPLFLAYVADPAAH